LLTDAVLIAVIYGAAEIIKAYWQRKPEKKAESERVLDISEAASEIAQGGNQAVEAVTRLLAIYEKLNGELKEEVRTLRMEISNANARITAMQIEEMKRDRLEQERNRAIADKIEGMEKYVKVLIDTLRDNGIAIPPRPGVLKDDDTLNKIRAVK